jgi:hypothetical protein
MAKLFFKELLLK